MSPAEYKQAASDLSLIYWVALSLQRGNTLLRCDALGFLLAASRLQALPAALIPVVFGNV